MSECSKTLEHNNLKDFSFEMSVEEYKRLFI